MIDYEILKVIWWLFIGVLLVGFAIMDGHDMGVGSLLPFLGRRQRTPRDDQLRRPSLGRKSSLAHHWRRRHVRCLADDVRHRILRILLGNARPAYGAHLPPGRL